VRALVSDNRSDYGIQEDSSHGQTLDNAASLAESPPPLKCNRVTAFNLRGSRVEGGDAGPCIKHVKFMVLRDTRGPSRARALPAKSAGSAAVLAGNETLHKRRRTRRATNALRTKALRVLSLLPFSVGPRRATRRGDFVKRRADAELQTESRAARAVDFHYAPFALTHLRAINPHAAALENEDLSAIIFPRPIYPEFRAPLPPRNRRIPISNSGIRHARTCVHREILLFSTGIPDRKKYPHPPLSLSLSLSLFVNENPARAADAFGRFARCARARAPEFISASEGARLRLTFLQRARGERVSGELTQGSLVPRGSAAQPFAMQLANCFRNLFGGLRDRPAKQNSLCHAYEHSWDQVVQWSGCCCRNVALCALLKHHRSTLSIR